MTKVNFRVSSGLWAISIVLAAALVLSASAQAQQYLEPQPSSGAGAGTTCSVVESDDGSLNEGDFVEYPGDFAVAPGAVVVLDDADGTQGTLRDGVNAEIAGDGEGNIEISVTGDPESVSGGDGALSDEVCGSIVSTLGVAVGTGGGASEGATSDGSASNEGSSDEGSSGASESVSPASGSPITSVLPDTGGAVLTLALGALALAGAALTIFRRRAGSQR